MTTATSDEIAAAADFLLTHVNGDHQDALLLIGRTLGEQPDAASVRAVGVDADGMDLIATAPDGVETALRVAFPEAAADIYAMRAQAIALVLLARERSGEEGQTVLERQALELAAIRTFITSVVAVREVTPHVRRITFGGGDLATFRPGGPDQFLYVLLPPPGHAELTIDRSFTWSQFQAMPEHERPVGAYYTVREWRPDVHELDMDS